MIPHKMIITLLAAIGLPAAMGLHVLFGQPRVEQDKIDALFAVPRSPPTGPLKVFHLGHSLVGRDMPAMLQQLVGAEHSYASQLGWGTSLKSHWEPRIEINGFDKENHHDHYRDAREALESGEYDAFIATEMVEIRDAIKYHQSSKYLGKWAKLARLGNPDMRIYLFETWHSIYDPEGWMTRLDGDLGRYWEQQILLPALIGSKVQSLIHVIPAGQVFANFVRALDASGGIGAMNGHESLFRREANGTLDPLHLNDIGNYLVALTHYAVLYHKNPVGLPHKLLRADGKPATAPSEQTARLMQEIVWQVVTSYPKTGVAQFHDR